MPTGFESGRRCPVGSRRGRKDSHQRREMRFSKGKTVALAVAGLAGAALPAGAAAKGFKYGVTASEVTSSSALVWTRSDKGGKIVLDLSSDGKFGNKDDKHKTLNAAPSSDRTAQT